MTLKYYENTVTRKDWILSWGITLIYASRNSQPTTLRPYTFHPSRHLSQKAAINLYATLPTSARTGSSSLPSSPHFLNENRQKVYGSLPKCAFTPRWKKPYKTDTNADLKLLKNKQICRKITNWQRLCSHFNS